MAVGPSELPVLHPINGIRTGVASAGIKKPGRRDLVVFELSAQAQTAATFTRNAFCAAPVVVAKEHLQQATPRYLLINTGNANAGTGVSGEQHCRQSCQQLAELTSVAAQQVLPFSTGVIGEPLPVDKIIAALPTALADCRADGWAEAAEGILTTDTRPKASSRQWSCQGQQASITGISKGAGMIKPNMATMLAFIATDVRVEPALLQALVNEAVNLSFNRITVDGDTSTNDACVLVATGSLDMTAIDSREHPDYAGLRDAVVSTFIELAQAIVRDGEGASKFVAVEVCGGRSEQECVDVAYTVAESPLVKTALFASDPNWGRILAAIGRAGVEHLDVSRVSIDINQTRIAEGGGRAASYSEQQGVAAMAAEEIDICIDLGRGEQRATVWTTDLSYDYIKINAEYRT